MKHAWGITLLLLGLFLASQIVGLATVNRYIRVEITPSGEIDIIHQETVIGPPPKIEKKSYSFIPITLAVLIGTFILFMLIKFGLKRFWKLWFLLSVWITMAVAFGVYTPSYIALALAGVLAVLKVWKPHIIIHNFTEIFVYSGITIIILPFLNLISGFLLLLIISIYDIIAVWKSKHMIKLAKFQTQSKLFSGLLIDYGKADVREIPEDAEITTASTAGKTAILGGGDIAFPLMFSSAVMEHLILFYNIPKFTALLQSFIITLFVSLALFILFMKGEKGKFYPAMPFLSIGCMVGMGVIFALNLALV